MWLYYGRSQDVISHHQQSNSRLTPSQLTVSAAARLKEALEEITPLSQAQFEVTIRNNFGSSGDLLQQIINGAPVDVLVACHIC